MSIEQIEVLTEELDSIIEEGRGNPSAFEIEKFKDFCLKATKDILSYNVEDIEGEYIAYSEFFATFVGLGEVLAAFDDIKNLELSLEAAVAMMGILPAVAQTNSEHAEELAVKFEIEELLHNVSDLEEEYPVIVSFKLGDKLTTIFNHIKDPESYKTALAEEENTKGIEELKHLDAVKMRKIDSVRKMSAGRPKLGLKA